LNFEPDSGFMNGNSKRKLTARFELKAVEEALKGNAGRDQ
jgi:hypothetical protein